MHTRDYSEDTSRVVDEEVARILREQEARATAVLHEHRSGLESVARALLEFETVDGAEIARLVDTAYGKPVHGPVEGEDRIAPGPLRAFSHRPRRGAIGLQPALEGPSAAERSELLGHGVTGGSRRKRPPRTPPVLVLACAGACSRLARLQPMAQGAKGIAPTAVVAP